MILNVPLRSLSHIQKMTINKKYVFFKFKVLICFLLLCSVNSVNATAINNPLIFPIPQSMKITSDDFVLDESVTIVLPQNASDEDVSLSRFLTKELSDKYGLALKTELCSDLSDSKKIILMGRIDNPLIKKHIEDNHLEINAQNPIAEGYILHVTNNKILIAGFDNSGAFYGLQSLRQLIHSGNGEKVSGVNVRDWPDMPFRAIRLLVPGPENVPFFKRFMGDFMALYKYNRVIIEFNNMRLDKHPELNAGWIEFSEDLTYSRRNRPVGIRGEGKTSSHHDSGDGVNIEKRDVRDIVEFANKNFIEVIPEIPSLTHVYNLLTRHPELAEYPGDSWPDTYCPSNPESYKLLFDVYDEYIDVINPKMVNIGHDEWRVPIDVCPRCKGKDFSELFAQDVNKIYDYLSEKGIKVAMWGDHLLESVRNAGPRDRITQNGIKYQIPGALPFAMVKNKIPKDILILNWFFSEEKDYGGQETDNTLQELGFQQAYGNMLPNIINWGERKKMPGVVGGAPSSWAATTEFNFGKDLIGFFLGSANLLWSKKQSLNPKEHFRTVQHLMPSIHRNLAAMKYPSETGDPIIPIKIDSYFNESSERELFGVDLSTLKIGSVGVGKKIFDLTAISSKPDRYVVTVGAKGETEISVPSEVKSIKIDEDVSSLIFLHACALPAKNIKAYFNIPNFFDTSDLLGWYEVVYEDGFNISIPIQYGVNILEWDVGKNDNYNTWWLDQGQGSSQGKYSYWADAVDCSSNMQENPINFFAFEWVNKRFGKKIKEINLHGSVDYQSSRPAGNPATEPMKSNAIMLLGLNAVKKREVQ